MHLKTLLLGSLLLNLHLSAEVLLDADFRQGAEAVEASGLVALEEALPGTGLRDTPHRLGQGVPGALVRDLREAPRWPDGRLQIARNEVEQGMHRIFSPGLDWDPSEQILVMRMTTFSDATTGGTNSIGVRLWVQNGLGPNDHRERLELSTHFNRHVRGARQVYPNAYFVRDGWETWAMPEGTNSRRAGIYYRLASEGRNEEIRGPLAVPLGFYWTWQGLDWPRGWKFPVGGGLYEPPARDAEVFSGAGLYTTTAIWARTAEILPDNPHAFATRVDLLAPRGEGRVVLQTPLPERIEEIRLILRSETPGENQTWLLASGRDAESDLLLGIADVRVALHSRADVNLDGVVDWDDWEQLRQEAGRTGALHTHGDLNGDGQVDLTDAFLLAARLPGGENAATKPEDWRAWRNAEGVVSMQIPAGGQLYGWKLLSPKHDLRAEGLSVFSPESAVVEDSPRQVGTMNVLQPLRNEEAETGEIELLKILSDPAEGLLLRLQTHLGAPALTLPVALREGD